MLQADVPGAALTDQSRADFLAFADLAGFQGLSEEAPEVAEVELAEQLEKAHVTGSPFLASFPIPASKPSNGRPAASISLLRSGMKTRLPFKKRR